MPTDAIDGAVKATGHDVTTEGSSLQRIQQMSL